MSSSPFELNHSAVRAVAGAGKTTGLVDRVVEVFRKFRAGPEVRAPRIVLTTFTRKATQELKERLILRACSEKDAELLQFVSDPSHLQISTIHGLLNVFLKQVGHLAGLDSGFQIISESEGVHMARLALRETFVENPSALRWLEVYGFERVLNMCRRYQTLAREQGELRPGQMSDLENAAKSEAIHWKKQFDHLVEAIEEGTEEPSWREYALRLRGFVESWKGKAAFVEGLPSKPRRSKKQLDLEFLHEPADELNKEFREELRKPCWSKELWPAMIKEWNEFAPFAVEFSSRLSALKDAQARFEIGDLELKSLEILRGNPFLGSVFSESWDYFMVDEYQDTSPLQVEILRALIGERKKYIVGDPQQSIYLFRGAEVGVFKDAEEQVKKLGGETREMIKNYRSTPELLSWINDFIVTLGPQFIRMEPRDLPVTKDKAQVLLLRAADETSELQGLVSRVQQLLNEGARLEQICVLGRTHRNLMEVSSALKAHGFPTHVHASRGFSRRREVLDAHALWKFFLNPHDNLNLMVLLRSPWFFVEDWRLSDWMKDRPSSLWRRLLSLADLPEAIARLKACREQLNQDGMVRTFESALSANAYIDLSLVNDPAGRKESNLWKLIHKAQSLEKEGGQSLLSLMESEADDPLDINEGDATSAQEPSSINLMTIHGSKGLQFDHVLIPGMGETPRSSSTPQLASENGIFFFPSWSASEGEFTSSPLDLQAVRRVREREFQEYDRWLYVALTRAKESLTLSWSSAGRDSWVKRSSWFFKPVGLVQKSEYTYQVAESMPEPELYRGGASCEVKVREPFRKEKRDAKSDRHSVTELIEREIKVKATSVDLIKRWQAQNLGVRIHRALQALKYQNHVSGEGLDDEAIRYVLELKDPPLKSWIENGRVEWGFQVQAKNGQVIEGQIDLWSKYDGKLYVVDYKSGSPANKESAFQQLSLYAWALRKFGHSEPAELVVVYPLLKKTERRPFDEKLFLHWESETGGT